MVASRVGLGSSRGMRPILLVLFCAMPVVIAAQEPVRAGANGVPVPRLQTFVAPEFPGIALLYQREWNVSAEALVGTDGRVQTVRILRPEEQTPRPQPLNGSAALLVGPDVNGVRRAVEGGIRTWVFSPPMVNGRSAPVTVPIAIRYEVFTSPSTSFFAGGTTPPAASRPDDFSLVYSEGFCTLDTGAGVFTRRPPGSIETRTARVSLTAAELDSVYQEMRRVHLFDYPSIIASNYRLEAGALGRREAEWSASDEGIAVTMRLESSGPTIRYPNALHVFSVTQNGTTTATQWDDAYVGPALSAEVEGVRSVIGLMGRILDSHLEIRDLKATATTQCRGNL